MDLFDWDSWRVGCHFDRLSDQRENGLEGHFYELSDRWGKFSDRTKETGPETGWLVTEPCRSDYALYEMFTIKGC